MEAKSLIIRAICGLLFCSSAFGASPDRPLVSAALPLDGSSSGTYLFIQSEDTTGPAVYQVFRKDGKATSANPYALVGQMRPQTDPRTINALLQRGESLFGDDLSALESTLDSFLQAIVDDPSVAEITMPEKLAVLIDFSLSDAEIRDNLRFLAKRFKGVGLCMGTAFAETASGQFTYELRQADFDDQDPYAATLVIARLTLDTLATAPQLPAPTYLSAIPMTDARGNRVVRLRWASPVSLREKGPIHYGYTVFRDGVPVNDVPILPQRELDESEARVTDIEAAITDRFTIPANWEDGVLAEDLQADASYQFPEDEVRREQARSDRIIRQNALEDLQGVFHFIDDGGLARGDGSGLNPGDQHTYTVAALDVLGRPGVLSSPLTVTVPGLLPLDIPTSVQVDNTYTYNSTTSTSTQRLKVRWPALRDDSGDVLTQARYIVYRWNSPTEYLRYRDYPWGYGATELSSAYAGRALPPIGIVATPVEISALTDDGYYEWTDPTIDINYESLQVHYTVRSVIDSGNGFPVLSGHSAPSMGVLRDREGPAAANILGVRLPCPNINVTCADSSPNDAGTKLAPGNKGYIDVSARLTDVNQTKFFRGVEFYYKLNATAPNVPIGFINFDSSGKATTRLILSTMNLPTAIIIACRAQLKNGFWSDATECTLVTPKGTTNSKQSFNVSFNGYDYSAYNGCGSTYFPYEVDGTEIDPAFGVIPASDTYAYSLYRRVDNGALELLRNVELETELSNAVALNLLDDTPPNFYKRLCYYYQGRDQHGNPGPLQRIDCLSFGGPQTIMPRPEITRIYRTEGSTDANAGLTLEFFCPPAGVESFLIEIRHPSGDIPLDLGPFDPNSRDLNTTIEERTYPEGHLYAAYASVALSLLDQDSGLFSLDFGNIEPDADYAFRVIARGPYFRDETAPADLGPAIAAVEGEPSEELSGNWRALTPRSDAAIPEVRWPARGNIVPLTLIGNGALAPTGPIAAKYVDINNIWKGVGVEVASFTIPQEFGSEKSYPAIDGKSQSDWYQVTTFLEVDQPADWSNKIYDVTIPGPLADSPPLQQSLLPCILYRMMVDSDGNPISGDLVQCSPLIANDITLAIQVSLSSPVGIVIRDPFLLVGSAVSKPTGGYDVPLYIKDNQPVIRGEIYRYYLALFDDRGEVAAILNIGDVTIP